MEIALPFHGSLHVVKSILAAETLAPQEGAENCCILQSIIDEIYQLQPEEHVQVKCLTDNQSLCDTLYSTKSMNDKRLKVDICMICKIIENKESSQVSWIDTKKQLANCLTKKGAPSKSLLIALSGERPLL